MRVFLITLLFSFLGFSQYGDNSPAIAFPAAEGPGKNATGGRGGVLIIVDTYNSTQPLSGPLTNTQGETYYTGGIKSALSYNGAAYIIFNISGNIDIGVNGFGLDNWGISGDKTIFGQSAPLGGVTLTGGTIRSVSDRATSRGNQNLIIRYLRSRPLYGRNGQASTEDDRITWSLCFQKDAEDIIVDHCSFSFAQDKLFGNFSTASGTTTQNITYQHILAGDGGTISVSGQTASATGINTTTNISYLKNLLVHGSHRTPNIKFDGEAQVANQVVFDCRFRLTNTFGDLNFNYENNYLIMGDAGDIKNQYQDGSGAGQPLVYSNKNIYVGDQINLSGTDGQDESDIWVIFNTDPDEPVPPGFFTPTRHTTISEDYIPMSAEDAYNLLVTNGDVGAYKYLDSNGDVAIYRDDLDTEFLTNTRTGDDTYTPTTWSTWLSGFPTLPLNERGENYDTDNDGMCDAWETAQFGNLTQGYGGDFDGDGYENIEEYMNQVDGDVTAPDPGDPPQGSPGNGLGSSKILKGN
jgi:hypothetical protein